MTIEESLLAGGYAHVRGALSAEQCRSLRAMYEDQTAFRSRVVMERHNFGSGEYKYFGYPLPEPVRALRENLYRELAPAANRWNELLRIPQRYPLELQQYLLECTQHGQARPTALLLRYRAGDYNCLHEDRHGELAFPFQATYFLSG